MSKRFALYIIPVICVAGIAAFAGREPDHLIWHVSGDAAPTVRGALVASGVPTTNEAGGANVELILLRRWSTVTDHMPWLARICRQKCDGQADLVTLTQPGWRGRHRTVIVNLASLGAAEAVDTDAPIPDRALRCVSELALSIQQHGAPCGFTQTAAWRLPYGL